LGHAHNVFINFAAETGILGLGAFLLFWLALAYRAARQGLSDGSWHSALALGVLGVWAYLTVHGVFDNLFVQHLQLQLALLLASLAPAGTAHRATEEPGIRNDSRTTIRIAHVQ
jgi:O-antigen ligase